MDYGDYYDFRPYVSAGARRAQAARELAKLQKNGRTMSPVLTKGRAIARTFWGEAWCDNLERYSDYANRLPRGRTYVRNGSVVDLQVGPGSVTALVSGSTMYEVKVTVGPVPHARWSAVCGDCSGAIDSLVELLQGRLSKAIMTRLCEEKAGLFPSPKEISFTCSCPDWASMCKHVAAVLYGIGARLDLEPELLFTLRKVDQQDLITKAGADLSKKGRRPASAKVLVSDDLSEMFGIEMAAAVKPATRAAAVAVATKRATAVRAEGSPGPAKLKGRAKPAGLAKWKGSAGTPAAASKPASASTPAPAPTSTSAPVPRGGSARLTAAKRLALAARVRKAWAARKALLKLKKPKGSESL
jgi:uncharacterized Zn finger protein